MTSDVPLTEEGKKTAEAVKEIKKTAKSKNSFIGNSLRLQGTNLLGLCKRMFSEKHLEILLIKGLPILKESVFKQPLELSFME